jgi:hypothetical protein
VIDMPQKSINTPGGAEDLRIVYAIVGFASTYSFVFNTLIGVAYDVSFAQLIIAFTSALFQLLTPQVSRSTRAMSSPYLGETNTYTIVNLISVLALTYAVSYAFGVTDLVAVTIAAVSTYTLFAATMYLRLPPKPPATMVLLLSLLGGGIMTSIDLALLIIFKLLIGTY